MSAKTLLLSVYGELGAFIDETLRQRQTVWEKEGEAKLKAVAPFKRSTIVGDISVAQVRKEQEAKLREIEHNKEALRRHRDERPTRTAIVYEMLEKGAAVMKSEAANKKTR